MTELNNHKPIKIKNCKVCFALYRYVDQHRCTVSRLAEVAAAIQAQQQDQLLQEVILAVSAPVASITTHLPAEALVCRHHWGYQVLSQLRGTSMACLAASCAAGRSACSVQRLLQDGKHVSRVQPYFCCLLQAHSFELDLDTTKFGEYIRGGIVTQHKESKQLSFKKLSEALENPGEFLLSDFSKLEQSPQLHLAFQALNAYQVTLGVDTRSITWLAIVCTGIISGRCFDCVLRLMWLCFYLDLSMVSASHTSFGLS